MRSCWIDKGNVPDTQKLQANQITRPVFDITDPQVNKDFLNRWRQPPFDSVGVYACANWQSDQEGHPVEYAAFHDGTEPNWTTHPDAFARWVDKKLSQVAGGTGYTFPHVSLNIERAWVVLYPGGLVSHVTDTLIQWRLLRPTTANGPGRATMLVLDGFQGGLWYGRPNDVAIVNQSGLEAIEVEAFGGSIKLADGTTDLEQFDPDGAVLDLTVYGFERVVPCHDAKYLRRGWRGSSFTQGRLP